MKKKAQPKSIPTIETIPCPAHGLPLELKEQDGKLIAVCNCNVKGNKHAGLTVYEATIEHKEN